VTGSTDVQHRPNRFASAGAKTKQSPTQPMGDFGIATAAMHSGGEAENECYWAESQPQIACPPTCGKVPSNK